MDISILNFFNDPEIYFNLSYRINQKISSLIDEELKANNIKAGIRISLNMTVDSKTNFFEILKPKRKSKKPFYDVFIPHSIIDKNDDFSIPTEEYINYLFRAVNEIVVNDYGYSNINLNQVKEKATSEILNNKEYEIQEEEKFTSELSDEELREILGDNYDNSI